ncbi:sulfotransferase family cytosolic 1B member 1-like [Lingula anatina]|uniref:Sulfotransferase family cytosolic 1B member 1-like n=1 Tax=Lingula anatina TaxID=7574 RepID=A0A1S3I8D4_LINAN|nr:sulfotransferase family cytosolic 1B member 1-like [Lingula anatina]|eukprot:XP_013394121.1 sulfotransferase family cytosolic 1B member 1-like [Lingula anatina]
MKTVSILVDANRKYNGDVDIPDFDSVSSWLFLEELEREQLLMPIRPSMVVTTHIPRGLLPVKIWKNNKVIHTFRNPKDTAVSLYFYQRDRGFCVGDFEQFLQRFMDGELAYGSWFDKELDWWTHERQNPNVLFMSYEDRLKAPEESTWTLIEFLGLSNLPRDTDFLQDILQRTSFESTKETDGPAINKAFNFQTGNFFRKGHVGDWKNFLTVKQNEEFDKVYCNKMKGSDIPIQFE